MAKECHACFCLPSQVVLINGSPLRTLSAPARRRSPAIAPGARGTRCSLLSVPFPQPDVFATPLPVFSVRDWAFDARPELLGSLLWAGTLYLGLYGPRWAGVVHARLCSALAGPLGTQSAELVADATHSLPFLLGGLAIDAALRLAADGNAVGAIATGLTLVSYAGVGELERVSRARRAVSKEEAAAFSAFCSFADTRLRKSGRCHLVDVRSALASAPGCGVVARRSDATLRKFIRKYARNSRVSPNGSTEDCRYAMRVMLLPIARRVIR
eukprot:IDg12494t1